jgi:hypothetical protein
MSTRVHPVTKEGMVPEFPNDSRWLAALGSSWLSGLSRKLTFATSEISSNACRTAPLCSAEKAK